MLPEFDDLLLREAKKFNNGYLGHVLLERYQI